MTLLGLILGALSFLGISLCLIRLYVASRINRRHRFCEELITGDWVFVPLEMRPAQNWDRGGGASEQAGRAVTGQCRTHDKSGARL